MELTSPKNMCGACAYGGQKPKANTRTLDHEGAATNLWFGGIVEKRRRSTTTHPKFPFVLPFKMGGGQSAHPLLK